MQGTSLPQEERANAASHALGLLLALAALPVLAGEVGSVMLHSGPRRAGLLVFGLSMLAVYLASSVYHALPAGHIKRFF